MGSNGKDSVLATFEYGITQTDEYICHVTLHNPKTKEVICSFDAKPVGELSEVVIYDDPT